MRTERERERERESARGSPDHAFDVAGEPRAPVRRSHAPVQRSRGSPDRTLQSDDRTLHSDDREEAQIACSSPTIDLVPLDPSIFNPPIFDPPISLCDFDFCCCCGGVVVVFWWLWLLIAVVCCHGLNWSFGGVWCWDLAVILKFFVIKFVWILRK